MIYPSQMRQQTQKAQVAFLITSTGWGGLEMNVLKLARLLSERGYCITLITNSYSTIYKNGKAIFEDVVLLKKPQKHFDFSSARQISKSLKKTGINTLMVFDNKDLDLTCWAKRLFYPNLRVVYQQHMQIGIQKRDLLHTLRFNSIDWWISPLQYLKNEISVRTKYPVNRVVNIPLCTDIQFFTTRKYSKQEALQMLNIYPQAPLVGIIGRISEKKGQMFLVQAIQELRKSGTGLELLVFGSATVNDRHCQAYDESMRQYVHEHELDKIIHFVEYQPDVAKFYNAIDIFALASHSETYGMVTIEAMLSGLPIIATNSGGTSEILEYGKLGYLYEYENLQDFSDKMKKLVSDFPETKKMADQAKKVAMEKYNQETEITAIDQLLKKCIIAF